MSDYPRHRGLGITGPFILIGLGIVLLLQQLNILQWSLWEVIFRLWPLIVIAVGLDILIARRSFIGAILSLLLVLALLLGGLSLMGAAPARGQRLNAEEVSYALGDAAAGDLTLTLDAGTMNIGALAADSPNVVAGTIRMSPSEEVASDQTLAGSRINVTIQSRRPRSYIFTTDVEHNWNLALTRRVPLALDISLGAGQVKADLTGMKISSVDAKIGAGQLILTLPSGSSMDVNVSIGAGSAKVQLPAGAGVKVSCTTGVGNCALPNGSGFWGQNYTSPEYPSSEFKVNININVGVGEGQVG
jgi:hypothetical protein